eukprot:757017-Hanusia_phi.AAC.1
MLWEFYNCSCPYAETGLQQPEIAHAVAFLQHPSRPIILVVLTLCHPLQIHPPPPPPLRYPHPVCR